MSQSWFNMILKKTIKLVGHKLRFGNLNPILCIQRYKETAHTLCSDNTIRQYISEIS
jgi:hypothetical protein